MLNSRQGLSSKMGDTIGHKRAVAEFLFDFLNGIILGVQVIREDDGIDLQDEVFI